MIVHLYRNVRLLLLALILIGVWGLSSFATLPRLEDPELISRNAVVTTLLPGASAERVEALITENIEREITDIEEIVTYESTSRAGTSILEIELAERVTASEVDTIWSRVRDNLGDAAVAFPGGTTDPELEEVEVKAYALVLALTWEQDEAPSYAILRRLASTLKDRLDALPGTESVDLFGEPDEEVVVEVDPWQLTSLGLSTDALARQLAQTDVKQSAGQLRGPQDLLLEVSGELDSLARLAQTPIRLRDSGQAVTLGEVAQIRKGTVEPLREAAIASGRPAIALGVFVRSDYRLDQWTQQVQPVLDAFRSQLSEGLALRVLFDQTRYVTTRLNGLIFNLLLGGALVFAVTLVMMGWQSAVIVGTALPLSLLIVFGLMGLLGIPLHQMSITGLIVALGILIDTAIVMVDEVRHRLRPVVSKGPAADGQRVAGPAAAEVAISQSVQHLAVPLLSSTITTVLAFMPIALLPGSVGEFVGTIGVGVILAVSASFALSITVIPVLAAHLDRGWQRRLERRSRRSSLTVAWWRDGISIPAIARGYRALLRQMLQRPLWGIALALLLPAAGFLQAPFLDQQFFPASDRDQVQIELELSASTSLEETQAVAKQMRDRLLTQGAVADVHWFVGTSAPRFYYNLTGGRDNEANYAQAMVQLTQRSSAPLVQQLQRDIDDAFPTTRAVVRQLEQGPPFDAPIEVRLYGPEVDRLRAIGEGVRSQLVAIPSVTHTRASLNEVRPQVQFALDETAARRAGLDYVTVARQLDQTLEGVQGGSLLEETEELPVRVRVLGGDQPVSNYRASLKDIASLPLISASEASPEGNASANAWVSLDALGDVALTAEPAKITHYNGQRVNVIQGFLEAGTLPATALSQFQRQLQLDLPPGYSLGFGGEAEERSSAVGNLVSTVGVLAVLTVATLVLSLGSFRLALLIGGVAIAAFGLGLFSVALFGYPFGFNPIIGTIGLIGVAINDSIVVLSALNADPGARRGDRAAAQRVVLRSTRHVLATTLTTMVGFVPLLLDGGEFWPPLAVAIAGGVAGATLLALFFIPSAYLWVGQRR
ncbi:MAG: efflux RND transporter permease subunit [Elainellaceae cyanobacterium]